MNHGWIPFSHEMNEKQTVHLLRVEVLLLHERAKLARMRL